MKLNRGRFHRMIWDSVIAKPSRDLLPFRTLDEWRFWCAQVRETRWAKAQGYVIDLPDFPCRAEIAEEEADESDIININEDWNRRGA